jgi:hypothetical protein
MREVISLAFGKIIDLLPGFILKLFFRPARIAKYISIELEGESPISLALNQPIPHVDLWFRLTNHSHVGLELDRLIVDVWFGQPTLIATQLRPTLIPTHKTTVIPFIRAFISAEQKAQIEHWVADPSSFGNRLTFYVTASMHSKVGNILLEKTIERHKI